MTASLAFRPAPSRLVTSALATSLSALALFLAPSAGFANEPFADPTQVETGKTLDGLVKLVATPVRKTTRDLRADAEKIVASDPRAAAVLYQQAAQVDGSDADTWLGLAKAWLAVRYDIPNPPNDRLVMAANAGAAAYRAYEKAKTQGVKAEALALVAEAYRRRAQWRPALNAYAASLALADRPQVRAAYTALRNDHGFRISDTRTEADAAAPRACVVFSENLSKARIDWSTFVRLDGRTPDAVTMDGRQICVDGLAHGRSYKLELRAGLPSAIALESLTKSVELQVHVRDRAASVRGVSKAYVLPATGQQGIPLTTTNAEQLGIEIFRIGDRGLAPLMQSGDFARTQERHDIEAIRERTGQKVYSGELAVTSKLNEEVTTAFPVSEALPKLRPGLYLLTAEVLPKTDRRRDARKFASQWFIVSDIGITSYTADDGVHAFVRSLTGAGPLADATVKLVAKNNEVLGTAKTDARGYVRFDAGLGKGEGGLVPQLLSAETAGGDYAFLDMSVSPFDLSDRGVKGREAPGPVDGYAYADRGVYRPGETVHLTALVRDRAAKAATIPVIMIVTRPDGVEHRRITLADQGLGGRTLPLVLGRNAMGGTWRAKVYTDPKAEPIAQAAFLVEDFVPERMDLKLEALTPTIDVAKGGRIKLAGRYLYGPPAANLGLEGEVVVKPSKTGMADFPGYVFGKADEKIATVREAIEGLPETGADGTASIDVKLPKLEKTSRPLDADIIVKLKEAGGRTVERTVTLPVAFAAPRLGVKPGFTDGQAREGDVATFDVVQLDATGKRVAAKAARWELSRLEQRWQWHGRGGDWSYDVTTVSRRVATGTVDIAADAPARIEQRLDWGRYRLDVKSADDATVTSLVFNAGWHQDEAADSPEMLELALDKPSYKAGDTARVKIASRFAGKALVTVMAGGLKSFKEVDVPAGGAEVPIEVRNDWGAGAYVAATLFRPLDGAAKRMPGRALGLRWLAVDQDARTLKIAIDAPEKIKSGAALDLPVKVAGLAPGEEARLTLAATDVGILNLTRFEAPKPEGWFYGQRKLGLDIRDYYARLIDGMKADKGRLRSGGDGADAGGMSSTGSPPVEATLALFSGVVKVGPDGTARVPLQMPDFNGAVRLSAVAWSEGKVGSASKDMIVRDPVAMTVAAPRFLTLGDSARLQLDLHNVEGPAATYNLTVNLKGLDGRTVALATREITLKAGEKKPESLTLKPADLGAMPVTVRLTGPSGIDVKRDLAFDVKAPGGDIRRSTVAELAANGGKLTVSSDILSDLIPASAKATVHVGPLAALDVASLLNELDRYPYGCAEQTTSRALPLLYVNDIARQIGLGQDAELKERIEKAAVRLFEMQDASGAFGIWGPSDGDMWLSSYVTDFLLRAKEAKIAIDPRGLKLALDRLQNFVAYAQDFETGGESRAYALYVLARAGRAPVGELRYYVDAHLAKFGSALSLAHLGAAASLVGDKPRAETAFTAAMKALGAPDRIARDDYGSTLRDRAAVLTLASETKMLGTAGPGLVDVLAKAYQSKLYTSTQEQAWMLLAARSLADQADNATLTVAGQPHKGKLVRALSAAELKAGALTITNEADAASRAVVSVIGAALTPEPATSKGFRIERSFFTLDGKKVDLASGAGGTSKLKQNERLVVVLKVQGSEKGGRILLVDRLPAGFEIENPRLVDSGDVKTLDWLKTERKPEHTEFKDDRFVAAFNFFGNDSRRRRGGGDDEARREATDAATVAYIVRAVTPGSFVHPAATVEDMYRPERHARTATGRLDVESK